MGPRQLPVGDRRETLHLPWTDCSPPALLVTCHPMPSLKIALMVVWLSNTDGSIVAQAAGVAVDVATCQQLAAKKIADESGNPDLTGSTARFSCWNTSTKTHHRQHDSVPGSVEL